MSVINKMLQDLDRRSAVAAGGGPDAPQPVQAAAAAERTGHEWFWRTLAVLILACVGWVGWVAYQLQPRPLITPLAARTVRAPVPAPVQKPAPPPPPAPVVEVKTAPAPVEKVEPQPAKAAGTFKLARSIETPITELKKPAPPEPKKAALSEQKKPAASQPAVDKRERTKAMSDAADARFRRAVAFLNQARVSEGEEELIAALQIDPSHVPARQAYVALLLEQQRVATAARVLREAVAANPSHPVFSLALARVYTEQRDYPAALNAMDKVGPAAQTPEFQALRGAVLQRMGRHAEAVQAYEEALQKSTQPGSTWAGFAVSLEALGRPEEAVEAYQRALGAGPLPAELREYAEARIRALR